MGALHWIQCSPNFSEGRRAEVIDAIVSAITSHGVVLLGVSPDAEHNRTVVSFAGPAEQVKAAAIRGAEVAVHLIDLNRHSGNYPRMGAVDVIPLNPVGDCPMSLCVEAATQVGETLGAHLNLPVFLYGEAARHPERRQLAAVRGAGFEALREEIGRNPDREPDLGPSAIHPTAGATAVGARQVLLGVTITLGTGDSELAEQVAAVARQWGEAVRVLLAPGTAPGRTEMLIQIANSQACPLHLLMEQITAAAKQGGVAMVHRDVTGLVPLEVLVQVARHCLGLEQLTVDQVLEQRILGGIASGDEGEQG